MIFPALGFGGSIFLSNFSIEKVLRNGFFQLLASSWFWRQCFSFQNHVVRCSQVNFSECDWSRFVFTGIPTFLYFPCIMPPSLKGSSKVASQKPSRYTKNINIYLKFPRAAFYLQKHDWFVSYFFLKKPVPAEIRKRMLISLPETSKGGILTFSPDIYIYNSWRIYVHSQNHQNMIIMLSWSPSTSISGDPNGEACTQHLFFFSLEKKTNAILTTEIPNQNGLKRRKGKKDIPKFPRLFPTSNWHQPPGQLLSTNRGSLTPRRCWPPRGLTRRLPVVGFRLRYMCNMKPSSKKTAYL